jgi:hypothetical protein
MYRVRDRVHIRTSQPRRWQWRAAQHVVARGQHEMGMRWIVGLRMRRAEE